MASGEELLALRAANATPKEELAPAHELTAQLDQVWAGDLKALRPDFTSEVERAQAHISSRLSATRRGRF